MTGPAFLGSSVYCFPGPSTCKNTTAHIISLSRACPAPTRRRNGRGLGDWPRPSTDRRRSWYYLGALRPPVRRSAWPDGGRHQISPRIGRGLLQRINTCSPQLHSPDDTPGPCPPPPILSPSMTARLPSPRAIRWTVLLLSLVAHPRSMKPTVPPTANNLPSPSRTLGSS